MLHFVVGKPRSGKSYYASANQKGGAALVRELMNPDGRYIVTNLPLVMHELEAFMTKRGRVIDGSSRITLLEHSQVKQFWRYRGGGYVRDVPNDPTEQTELQLLQNDEIFQITGDAMHKRGVLYLLDEIHVYYPARNCMAKAPKGTGEWVFQYATQHGHFTDTIMMITQALSYVDKQFREMTQDYTFLENERLRKVSGFRKGAGFVARTFIYPPVLGTEQPDFVEEMPLDTEGYGAIYDTSGGAGISGGGAADKGAKAKGLPLKSIWFMGAAALVLVCLLLFGARHYWHSWLDRRLAKTEQVGGLGRKEPKKADPATAPAPSKPDNPPAVSQAVTWTRYVQRGAKVYVYLSDGRVVTAPSRVEYDGTGVVDFVDLDGAHWRLSRAPMQLGAVAVATEEKR